MNWTARIRELIGAFWFRVLSDKELSSSTTGTLGLLFSLLENRYRNWVAYRFGKRETKRVEDLPKLLSVSEDSVYEEGVPLEKITRGEAVLGDVQEAHNSVLETGRPCDDLGLLSRSTLDDAPLIRDKDFRVDNTRITLEKPLIDYGFQTASVVGADASGMPHVVYKLFGWGKDKDVRRENVNDILGLPFTGEAADIAWEIHVQGSTVYNAKRLLASLTGCLVAVNSGVIVRIHEAGGTTTVRIGEQEYVDTTGKPCNFSVGDVVKKGDVLFGGLHVYYDGELPPSDVVPSIRVMTDVGELTAENREMDVSGTKFHDEESGLNFLPLSGDEGKVNAYILRCREIARDANAPRVPVPDVVNPALFVLGTLRARRYCCIVVPDASSPLLEDAVRHIRRNTPSGAMLSLIFNTGVEAVALPEVTADAESAVSVEAEASIPDTMSADADSKELV